MCEWWRVHPWYSVRCCSLPLEWLNSESLADSLQKWPGKKVNQGREDRFTCHAAQNDNYIVISLWILLGSILAVIFVLTGIMENVLASQKRRLRKWMCTSVMIVSGHKRAAVRNCTVSAGHLMMSHSELIRASVWQFRKLHCSTGP